MNYNEALEYIHSVAWMGSRPGLSRTYKLLELLGNPEKSLRFVHVAGTNGKGSTCSMLNSVLIEAGYNVGLYTSPYIVRFNERMQVNGVPISDNELAELTEIVKPFAESMEDKPTEFELITALSFLYFKRHGCDIVVLEVGMGGRLDSTNVIESPVVSVITGVAVDHTAVLGTTVPEIAVEKAGIIKEGRPVVYGGTDDCAYEVISKKAKECKSELIRTDIGSIKLNSVGIEGINFDYSVYNNLEISLCGSYQPENAATVIETVRALTERGYEISERHLREGLKKARWRARFEVLSTEPVVVFDGSHNLQGITGAVGSIKQFFGDNKVVLLMGVLADKDYRDMVSLLVPLAESAFAITPNSPRALESDKLSAVFREFDVNSTSYDGIEEGVAAAYERAKTQNMPLVMLGSLYMYGDVYEAFKKIEKRTR